ncbi:hypothetical protein [Kribbella sp. NPDC006257]|uniref:hypothetical protein n=1 Tax=Kribbella sp. NPDC006257 TaxID=3156738 RepID=UPI0033B2BB16
MNEEDLNQALHDVMTRSSPPPSMDPAPVIAQGRRARKRRRVAWAGVAVVPLVVGVGAGPALVANFTGHRPTDQMVAGGGTPTTVGGTTKAPVSSVAPTTTRKTGDPWPEGQTDRTATAGPRAERAVTLMNDLTSVVPAGFGTPNLRYPDGRAMRWPQGQYASNDGEPDYWEYSAAIPVQQGDKVGELRVQSTTPDGKPATDPCRLAQRFWGGAGSCTIVDVGGKKVGVVTDNGAGRYNQWAAYRHDDGTVVYLAQAKATDDPDLSPLTQPIFTNLQLADLVTSPKFKISS